jgi:hypothetical protein
MAQVSRLTTATASLAVQLLTRLLLADKPNIESVVEHLGDKRQAAYPLRAWCVVVLIGTSRSPRKFTTADAQPVIGQIAQLTLASGDRNNWHESQGNSHRCQSEHRLKASYRAGERFRHRRIPALAQVTSRTYLPAPCSFPSTTLSCLLPSPPNLHILKRSINLLRQAPNFARIALTTMTSPYNNRLR